MKKALALVVALMMLMSLCVVPAMAAGPDGSADYPYQVAKPTSVPTTITIPANSTVYYQYKANVFNGWEVGGYGLSAITVDGVVYDELDMWGELYAPLKFNFMSPGVVGYVNNTAEDIEVMINHNEPVGSESNPDALVAGENNFSIPANNPSYVADYYPTASGEYTFECAQTEDFIISIEVDGNTHTLNGSLVLELERYIPVRVYISPVGNTPNVTINLIAPKAGTESNPIWLGVDQMDQSYAFAANESLYFSVDGALSGNNLTIESVVGAEFTALVDGKEYASEGGVLSVALDTAEWYVELILSSDMDNEVNFSVEYEEGTYENPIELVDGENVISIPEGGNYYYSYTAVKGGLLVITPADAAQFDLLDIGYEDASYKYHYAYLAEGAASALLPVPAGQTVSISACGVMDEETFVSGAVDTTLNVAVKDLLLYNTFEGADLEGDLEGWQSTSDLVLEEAGEESNVANGFYSAEFNVTKDWGNIYRHADVEPNTNYEVTFTAKAAKAGGLWVKFHKEDWSGDIAQGDVALTTEWAEYTTIINSGDNTSLWLLLQYAGYAVDGQIIWLDDIVITKAEGGSEPVEPAFGFVNGDFETGDNSGWEIWQSTSISADAAKDGAFGAHLVGNGGWGGLLNQTISVEAGKQYKLSFWINVNQNGVNVQVKNGAGATIEGAGGWFDANKKDHLVEWLFTATDDSVLINFCGAGNGIAEDAYVDNFVLAEVKAPSFDGYITNGDFETGDLNGWNNLWDSCGVEFVEGYESANALSITAGGWNQVRQNGIKVEPNTDYVLTAWFKNAGNFGIIVKNGDDSGDVASIQPDSSAEWTQVTLKFNSGNQSKICVLLIGWEGGGSAIVDNISLALDQGGDDPVVPPSAEGIVNGDFETGDASGWETWQSTTISADAAKDGAFGAHLVGNGGWGGLLNQTVAVEAGKQYKLSFWINVNQNGVNVQVKDGAGNGIEGAGGWFDTNSQDMLVEWIFTATDNSVLINFCGGGNGVAEDAYVDNFVFEEFKVIEPSFDGYITNGDFETGAVAPWENLWSSCPVVEIVEGGINGGYALSVVSGQWKHVRQTAIAVEANTNYKITVWVKNANNMCLLVKNGADSVDMANVGVSAGDEWTEFVVEFNSGDNTSIIFSLMGGEGADQYGMFDNIVMEKVESKPEVLLGDVDGNGKLNNRDLGLMQLYLNGYDLTDKTFVAEAADMDGNGKLNNRDLGMLQRVLNGF